MNLKWYLKTLGGPSLSNNNGLAKLSRRKSLALFVYLLVTRREYERESLANVFWPDLPEVGGRTALRSSISDLNRVLGSNWLSSNGTALSLNPKFPVVCDLHELEKSATLKKAIPKETIKQFERNFLEGFRLEGCDVFEEWCYVQREYATNRLFVLLNAQLNIAVEIKDWESVSEIAWKWISLDSLSEQPYIALMKRYQYFGQPTQALSEYSKLSERLQSELGVTPSIAAQKFRDELKEVDPIPPKITKQNFEPEFQPIHRLSLIYLMTVDRID